MKQFIKHQDETVLEERRSSKPAIVKDIIYLVLLSAVTVYLVLNLWFTEEDLDPVSTFGLMATIGKGLLFALMGVMIVYYINDIVRLITQRIIITDKRLVRYQYSLSPKYDEIPMDNIEFGYSERQVSISRPEDGDIAVITKDGYKKTFRDVDAASIVCQHITHIIVQNATETN